MAKSDQIIVRLSSEKKQQLQEIADKLKIDMSKLIRDKIDEIIIEYKQIENKKIYDESNEFIKLNSEILKNQIVTDELIKEMKDEFKKIFLDKMKSEIESTNITDFLNSK